MRAFWQESVVWRDGNPLCVETDDDLWLAEMTNVVELHSDGGVLRPRRCEAGSWAWVGVDLVGSMVVYQRGWASATGVLRDGVTNNQMELAGMLRALEASERAVARWSGRMCSDSMVTIGRFRDGWRLHGVPRSWQARMATLLPLLGNVDYVHLKGHPTLDELVHGRAIVDGVEVRVSEHQKFADILCTQTIDEWCEASGIARGRKTITL